MIISVEVLQKSFGECHEGGLIILLLTALIACSDKYEPVIDLKASRSPGEAQMDTMGCEWLAHRYGLEDAAVLQCLEGRGHSVIGKRKL